MEGVIRTVPFLDTHPLSLKSPWPALWEAVL